MSYSVMRLLCPALEVNAKTLISILNVLVLFMAAYLGKVSIEAQT